MTSLVGRTEELSLLRERLDTALDGAGRIVFVAAEAGAGKSTLLNGFLDEVREEVPDALVLEALCSEQYGAGEPYQPFVEAFRHLSREREAKKGKGWKELAKEIAPFWVAAIPVAGEAIAAGMMTASELRQTFKSGGGGSAPSEEALFFQYTELFLAAAGEQPIVLLIDDLHWADRATVSLLTHLGRQVKEHRVLILGSYRPAEVDLSEHPIRKARQELQRYQVAEELALEPLGHGALADLVRLRTGADPDLQLLDWIEQRAGSNALFFEELLDWLVHQGFTKETHGELMLARVPEEIEIPSSAEGTIEKRLDRLDPETRRVLEYASVDGNEFDSVSVSRLLDMDELDLEEILEPLSRVHRLLRLKETRDLPDGDIASVYAFSHSLIQSVLHRGLHGKRRILLHRKMAQILEEIHGADVAPIAHRLAIHYEEGRQAGRAFELALLAAERAAGLFAHWDALDQLERALRNAEEDGQRSQARERLADTYLFIGRFDEALEAIDAAIAAMDADADPARDLLLRHKRVVIERDKGSRPLSEVLDDLAALRAEAQQLELPAQECRIIWHMIDLPGTTESVDVALAREALELADGLGDPDLLARGQLLLGISLCFDGNPQDGAVELGRAAERYAELGQPDQEAACRGNQATAYIFLGQHEDAIRELEAAITTFDELVEPTNAAVVRTNLAALLRLKGDYDRAEQLLVEAIKIGERLAAPVLLMSPLQNLAEVHEDRGEWQEAEARWREKLEKGRETGYVGEQIIALCGIGTARLRTGDREGAVAMKEEARALADTAEEGWGEAGQALTLFTARLAADAGEVDGAMALLGHLREEVQGQDAYLNACYRLEEAEVLRRADPSRAAAIAREAEEMLRELDAKPLAERAERLTRELEGS